MGKMSEEFKQLGEAYAIATGKELDDIEGMTYRDILKNMEELEGKYPSEIEQKDIAEPVNK
jgi:hypothetical protein